MEGLWFSEMYTPDMVFSYSVREVLFSGQTSFQKVDVVLTGAFGKALFLDGKMQSAEIDEALYHEMLVHPGLLVHPKPSEVLIIGGGDGGTLREVLKHDVHKAVMVELDQAVVDAAKAYLPNHSTGFSDPRALVLYEDGYEFLKRTPPESYDAIIVDSPDPVGPAKALFTAEFYAEAERVLSSPGVLVVQAESPIYHAQTILQIKQNLVAAFGESNFYTAPVPSYPGGFWCFGLAVKGVNGLDPKREPPAGLRYYNARVHKAGFALPEFMREGLM